MQSRKSFLSEDSHHEPCITGGSAVTLNRQNTSMRPRACPPLKAGLAGSSQHRSATSNCSHTGDGPGCAPHATLSAGVAPPAAIGGAAAAVAEAEAPAKVEVGGWVLPAGAGTAGGRGWKAPGP